MSVLIPSLDKIKKLVIEEPVLESATVYLEGLSFKHVSQSYVSWLNDKEVCRENRHGRGNNTIELTRKYVESVDNLDNIAAFAILAKDTGKHIGNTSLGNISWENNSGEISILIGEKSYWGKGVAKETYRLLIEYGFNQLFLHRLYSGMTVRNKAMIKVAESSGMSKEGIFKEAFYKDGIYVDIVMYGIINPAHK
ncbi:acetyltransferase (GNAT) domain protein [Candidatus Omnitrophus magneticus]|uniref:Acetyltransferase (GNAT) domain protein n=1 Tax=Candidatus Omnitrophus magneticus TaxID=1609969 RepID=A0A0F0CXA2_9BACT|nr:acetyltransferase (GNAT) domain protein [Candidatus Omnitrophus magneticus]